MAANHHHTHWHLPLFAIEIVLFKFSRAVGTLFLFLLHTERNFNRVLYCTF